MQGHWESQTRKLNRHYQSAGKKDNWTNIGRQTASQYNYMPALYQTSVLYPLSKQPGTFPNSPEGITPPMPTNGKLLVLPSNNKIKIFCYCNFRNIANPSHYNVGFMDTHISNNFIARVWFYDANKNSVTNQRYPITPANSVHNLALVNNVYQSINYSTQLRNAYVISKDKTNPSVFEVDLTNVLTDPTYIIAGSTPVYYLIDLVKTYDIMSYNNLYVFTDDQTNPGIVFDNNDPTNNSVVDVYYRTEPKNVR